MMLLRHGGDEFGPFIGSMIGLICYMIILIPILVFMFVCRWKIFVKAGQEGWHSLIPFYGTYILTINIAGQEEKMFWFQLIPVISIYGRIMTYMALAKSFGKDEIWGIGLVFLGIVFFPMMAFDKKIQYVGPGGVSKTPGDSNSLTNNSN